MRDKLSALCFLLFLFSLVPYSVFADELPPNDEFDGYVVVCDDSVSNKEIRTELLDIASVDGISVVEDAKIALIDLDVSQKKAEAFLENSDLVEVFNPNYLYETTDADPYLDEDKLSVYQYFHEAVNAEEAWDKLEAIPHTKTRVAVIDTGVDTGHEDLSDNILTLDSSRKYQQFALGEANTINDDPDVKDWHGTHVAGIVGATYGNGKGGSGVASGHDNDLVDVLPVSASADGMNLYTYDICAAIEYASENRCRVVNMSFGTSYHDRVLESCIDRCCDTGMVFVAASGNANSNEFSSPADLSSVIAVNASDQYGNAAYWSDWGLSKDVSAPGTNVLSTVGGDRYGKMSGTSMASPVVAGVAALVLDADPGLSPSQVRNILCSTTGTKGVFAKDLAFGIVDAAAAVDAAVDADEEVEVDSVQIRENGLGENIWNADVGDKFYFGSIVLPATSLKAVTWKSTDESVATVDPRGSVTCVGSGSARISCTAGDKSDSVEVKVGSSVEYETLSIGGIPDDGVIPVSQGSGQFTVETTPDVDLDGHFTFKSSDEDVLFVDSMGEYEVKKAGTATVMLSESLTGRSVEKEIRVKNDVRQISFTKKTNYMRLGNKFTFEAKAVGDDLYKPEIDYSVTNNRLSIDKSRGVCTANKLGVAYVVARTGNGALNHVKVTVLKKTYSGADYALKVAKTNVKNRSKLTWKAQPLAKSYTVEKKVGKGKWTTLTSTTKLSCFDTKWTATSSYRVRAIYLENGKEGKYGYSSVVRLTRKYAGKEYALKGKVSGKIVDLSWKKQPYAKSYTVEKKIGKGKWKKVKTVKSLKYSDRKNRTSVVYYRVKANPDKNNVVCTYGYSNNVRINK